MNEGSFGSCIRKKSIIVKLVRHQNKLSRKAVDASSPEVFQAWLEGPLSKGSSGRCLCPMAGGWNLMIFKVLPNPNHSMTIQQLFVQLCIRPPSQVTLTPWLLLHCTYPRQGDNKQHMAFFPPELWGLHWTLIATRALKPTAEPSKPHQLTSAIFEFVLGVCLTSLGCYPPSCNTLLFPGVTSCKRGKACTVTPVWFSLQSQK